MSLYYNGAKKKLVRNNSARSVKKYTPPQSEPGVTTEYHTYEYIGNQSLKRDDGAILTFTDLAGCVFEWPKMFASFYNFLLSSKPIFMFGVAPNMVEWAKQFDHVYLSDGSTIEFDDDFSTAIFGFPINENCGALYTQLCTNIDNPLIEASEKWAMPFNHVDIHDRTVIFACYWDDDQEVFFVDNMGTDGTGWGNHEITVTLPDDVTLSTNVMNMYPSCNPFELEDDNYGWCLEPSTFTDYIYHTDGYRVPINLLFWGSDDYGLSTDTSNIDAALTLLKYNNGGTFTITKT